MSNEVFKVIYDKLALDLAADVFDHVPQDYNNFPFVVLRINDIRNIETDDELDRRAIIEVAAFSRYKGTKEIRDINDAVFDSLNRYAIPDTATFAYSTINQESNTIFLESDGKTRQSNQRFVVLYEPK